MFRLSLAAALLSLPTAGYACQVNDEDIPTNIQLIERADLVVLGKVVPDPESKGSRILLERVRTLKGEAPQRLIIYGSFRGRNGEPTTPTPTRLSQVHPSALWGSCDRQSYAPNALVLATFKRTSSGFMQMTEPFGRNVEDVEGPNGLWVRAAALYIKIIRENLPSQRRKAFMVERERLLAKSSDPDANAIAADIDRYLKVTIIPS